MKIVEVISFVLKAKPKPKNNLMKEGSLMWFPEEKTTSVKSPLEAGQLTVQTRHQGDLSEPAQLPSGHDCSLPNLDTLPERGQMETHYHICM